MRTLALALSAATLTLPAMPSAALANSNGYYQGRTWQDSKGRLRCKRSNGTTGTVLGAAAGALLGRHVDRNRKVRCR